MINNYIDTHRWLKLALDAAPKVNFTTGEVAMTRENVAKQVVTVFVKDRDSGESEMIKVTVAAHETPTVVPGQPVELPGLRATFWALDGRAGLAYSADGVQPVTAAREKAS